MITPAGTVKQFDFGNAKRMAPLAFSKEAFSKEAFSNANDTTANEPLMIGSEWLTQQAGILGTLPFMSPERCAADRSPKAPIYGRQETQFYLVVCGLPNCEYVE